MLTLSACCTVIKVNFININIGKQLNKLTCVTSHNVNNINFIKFMTLIVLKLNTFAKVDFAKVEYDVES